ncbi:MAG TPA: ABC transporter permease [Thermoleophilaceae bacterium]|nr:ABC transporter permease [Thermoleophilaceae bacterium]
MDGRPPESALVRGGRRVLNASLNVYAAVALAYLLVPVAIILLFSFNDTKSRFNFIWNGFTLEHWKDPFKFQDLADALVTSVKVGALTTLIATFLGTLMALALVRYQFRGRSTTNLFIFIPLATPEVVLGASLLSLFISVGVARGFTTILIAHVMFSVSFVVVTVRSRLIGFDRSIEEAAQDLGANGIQTFFRVTLPLIAPAVFAAALLTFALSLDDFVITNFNAGSTITYPLYVWGAARVSIPPQVNVLAAMIFLFTVAMMLLTVWQQRRAERMAQVRPEPEGI